MTRSAERRQSRLVGSSESPASAGVLFDQPRERLNRLGVDSLSDAELLALVIRTGQSGENALALAAGLLKRWGGLQLLSEAVPGDLCSLPGLGPAKSASLVAAAELGRRLASRRLERGDRIRGPEDVYDHFYQRIRSWRREHFMLLLLDGRHRVLRESQISQGTLTASLVHPREVFRPAVLAASAAVVLVHNHPSGDPAPSREDLVVTRRLVEAGKILGIRVVDHIIVAENGFHSLQENGQLSEG